MDTPERRVSARYAVPADQVEANPDTLTWAASTVLNQVRGHTGGVAGERTFYITYEEVVADGE